MFKKSTIVSRIMFSVATVIALLIVVSLIGFCTSPQSKTTSIQNAFKLDPATDISAGTVNFATPDGTATAVYTGSPIAMVKSITVGGDEIQNLSGETVNYVVSYTRGGDATTDLTSAGVVNITITGQNAYTGSIASSFTITKPEVQISFADTSDLKIDDTANLSLRNGSGLAAFITTTNGQMVNIAEGDTFITTYYNKTLGKSTYGFTNSGEYLVNVLYSSPNCTVVGPTSIEVYVKPTVLQNKDGSVRVESKKGFKQGITLGDSSITTNKKIISARGDINNAQDVKAMLNLTFLKNGKACIIEDELVADDELTVTAKLDCANCENLVLLNNDYANKEYSKVNFKIENGALNLTIKPTAEGVDNSSKEVGPNTYVLTEEKPISVVTIVIFAVTGVAILALLVLNIFMYFGGKKRK